MNNAQIADILVDSPAHIPTLQLSPEEEADLKMIDWGDVFLFDDED